MSKRLPKKFQYQQKEKSPANKTTRTTQYEIKTVDKNSLNITTKNGMKVQISVKEYSANRVVILKNCLQEGDFVEIVSNAGNIQKCRVARFCSKKFKVREFVRLNQALFLVFKAEEKVEKIKILEDTIEKKDIICWSKTGILSWCDLYYIQPNSMLDVETRLYYIGERIVAIQFDTIMKGI